MTIDRVSPTHKCPCDDCTTQVRRGLLMCLPHWRMVPAPLQREVYRTFRGWSRAPLGEGSELRKEYFKVVDQAINAVREKEIKRALRNQAHGDNLDFPRQEGVAAAPCPQRRQEG